MIMFITLFVVLSNEFTRSFIEDFGTFGSVVLASYPVTVLLCVAVFSAFCTYIMMLQYIFKPSLSTAKKIDLENVNYSSEILTTSSLSPKSRRPENVGIVLMEVYFPSTYVKQADLEVAYGVPPGKYVKGLGQEAMAFVGDREDINSISLTVVQRLLEKHNIPLSSIGRLEVGTESLLDKSKSTKTVLMDLFKDSGCTDVEGVTTINACYGGSAALFNAVAWVESSNWDGRYALVVAADIAVYDAGPARPTGGCGAVAMLVGPNALFVLEPGLRTTCAKNVWDFYKPNPSSEYPTVDGAHSQACYLSALDDCYMRFCAINELRGFTRNGKYFDTNAMDYAVFHSPYNKLVQKSFARLIYNDFLRNPLRPEYKTLLKWKNISLEESYMNRELDFALRDLSANAYRGMTDICSHMSRNIGNCYTASVFINLINLLDLERSKLHGKRILMFTYGSGSMASMYSLRVRANDPENTHCFNLDSLADCINLNNRLSQREACTPEEYTETMEHREAFYGCKDWTPQDPVERLFPGTFYLKAVDHQHKREYERKPLNEKQQQGRIKKRLSSLKVTPLIEQPILQHTFSCPVVSGFSAGLPGSEFVEFGFKNIQSLLEGVNCIRNLSSDVLQDMLNMNVKQLKKSPKGNCVVSVDSIDKCIKLSATMGKFDLTKEYGIPQSMTLSMDKSSQLAVAAGLEALKDASLVQGTIENGWGNWRLENSTRDTTGIIYATSFPCLDGAVNELNRFYTERPCYEFDRKFLFKTLVLANAQLAQITGARGPNIQINAACAGTTEAIGLAHDWISLGRCDRVVVIASDVASGDDLMPWIGSGFRALGAASLEQNVTNAALPFDERRNGMILGSGAVAMVLERENCLALRQRSFPDRTLQKCRLLYSQYSNSAFHGAALDQVHIAHEFNRFLQAVERDLGIKRSEIAQDGIYFSHETFTHATPTTSCAYAEVTALRSAFGQHLENLVLTNTKGFTGHSMGVSFEDIAAIGALSQGIVPPVVNTQVVDPILGKLNLSKGGKHEKRFALRFAAGFGSQLAFTLYEKNKA